MCSLSFNEAVALTSAFRNIYQCYIYIQWSPDKLTTFVLSIMVNISDLTQ